MAEQTRSELEQAAQIVGTIKQFLAVVESRTATLINEQKVENALASEAGVKLRALMAGVAADAKAVRDELTEFLHKDLHPVVSSQLQTAATEAGKRQAAAFGQELAGGIQRLLEAPTAKAAAAAVALHGVSWHYTWRGALMAACIAFGVILGIIGAAVGALYFYAPTLSELEARRAERDQLAASLEELGNRGARLQHTLCGAQGEKKRFCVLISKPSIFYDSVKNADEQYVIPIGY